MPKKTSQLTTIVLLIFFAFLCSGGSGKIRSLSTPAQRACIQWMSYEAHISQVAQAIFCGRPQSETPELDFEKLMIQMGIVHILVASGANVHITLKALSFSPQPLRWLLQSGSLVFLLLASGLAAPIVRASMQVLLIPISARHSLGLSHFRRVSLANLIYLFFFPADIFSMSFQLSVIASYTIAFMRNFPLAVNFYIFALMLPLLLKLQSQSIDFIFNNILIAPLISPLLMLLAFIASVLPPLAHLSDPLLMGIYNLLNGVQALSATDTALKTPAASLDILLYAFPKWSQQHYFICTVFGFEVCEFLKMALRKRFLIKKSPPL